MSIASMLRMSGHDFGLASVIAVGDYVRHYGTKMTGFVIKVVPQHDRTAELLVEPFPIRPESLDYHRGHAEGWQKPCSKCTDAQLCPGGVQAQGFDAKPRGWATYHVDTCIKPEDLLKEAETHHCHRCDKPEDFTDKKPCTAKADLRDLHARALATIARVAAQPPKDEE